LKTWQQTNQPDLTNRRSDAHRASGLVISTSADTLLRPAHPGGSSVPVLLTSRVLGVDNWAWRRCRSYGTMLVDLKRNTVADLLPDRQADRNLAQHVSMHHQDLVERLGLYIALLTNPQAGEGVVDLDGTYCGFFGLHGITALVVCPDIYVHGAAAALGGVDHLLGSLAVATELCWNLGDAVIRRRSVLACR